MRYFYSEQEYRSYLYKKDLRRTANSLGLLMLLYFGAQLFISIVAVVILQTSGTYNMLVSGSPMELLLDGALSSVVFFLIGLIYCFIKQLNLSQLFPFNSLSAGTAAMLTVVGLTVSLMSNYAAGFVTDVFSLFGVTNHGGATLEEGSVPSVFLYYLAVSVMPALVEEFAFRGVVMGSLRKYSDALALVVSSALFALMHGNFVQIPFTFCCGLAFGFVVIKSGSLLPAILIHFFNNALAVTSEVLTSYGIVTDDIVNIGYGVIFVITGALSLIFIPKLLRKAPDLTRFGDSDDGIPFREKVKTAASSPTTIAFAAVMILYAIFVLAQPTL